MNIMAILLIVILVASILAIVFWDPLEKYDRNLDAPDFKVNGSYADIRNGKVPPRKRGNE